MTGLASVSRSELMARRQRLKRERRKRTLQNLWRLLLLAGMAGGMIWVTTLPAWVIRKPEQIEVEGNQVLSAQAVRSLLALSYPQYLLRLQPQNLATRLEGQPAIVSAKVTRQLFPPSLMVQVQERKPVAIAINPASQPTQPPQQGLLDAQGIWIPYSSYSNLERNTPLPTLKIIGKVPQYRSYWPELYPLVKASPVKISEVDWQNPANIILKTEQGLVHLGPYSPRFAEQLKVLDQMRELSSRVNTSEISYIDLKNPEAPALQMRESTNAPARKTPEN